jgi:CRP-like cAMP-binding protein
MKAGAEPGCAFVPFRPGRRPEHEAAHPGQGSSEDAGVILSGGEPDPVRLLYTLSADHADPADVRATVSFTGPNGDLAPVPVPGWEDRPLPPVRFARTSKDGAELVPATTTSGRLVLSLSPADDLLPGSGWAWHQLGEVMRDGATDGCDPFTFGHLFSQRVRVDLRVLGEPERQARAMTSLMVCDLRRCGSLYARLLERLVGPDVARQAEAADVPEIDVAYHPWFPVLRIGADKAALYTRALVEDIARAGEQLSDPGWLMRVGLYLEFLTFLGICEAVRDDVGDLLSSAERRAFETAPAFAELRARVNPEAWRGVWRDRAIAFSGRGAPRTGPVSGLNLLAKKKTTLRFLHVHHEDLKHAIALAGENRHNTQETWQRVFRDAERAVLRNIPEAFPELGFMPGPLRDLILWHRGVRIPPALGGVLADQQGLFASACSQYRASMNAVAEWAKAQGLVDYTGRECVPRQVSLLEAHVNQPARVALLQRRDGYGPALDIGATLPERYRRPADELPALLADAPLFAGLRPPERQALARAGRPMTLGPTERLVIEGQQSSRSLFVLAEGRLEVVTRDENGHDHVIDQMDKGSVIGEMSMLSGAPYNATVRAIDGAIVYEFGDPREDPIVQGHPDVLTGLQAIMEDRQRHRADREATARRQSRSIGRRLRAALFAG